MKKYLAEANWGDFETFDIGQMFSNTSTANSTTDAKSEQEAAKNTKQQTSNTTSKEDKTQDKKDISKTQDPKNITDWGKELKNRLDANKALSSEAKLPEYQIEDQFFKEYYSNSGIWDEKCAKALFSIGTPLKKAFKVLGFDKTTNPILGFISQKYVREKLLATGLLNVNTFKAIYSAVAENTVADSEFLVTRDYNIIYCPALYKKSLTDIDGYLEIQKSILKPKADKYTLDTQIQNRKVFINLDYIKDVAEKTDVKERLNAIINVDVSNVKKLTDSTVELNSVNLAKTLSGKSDNKPSVTHIDEDAQIELLNKLTKPEQMFAVLQYLLVNARSNKAKEVLASSKFSPLSPGDIIEASAWLVTQKLIPAGKLNIDDANSVAEAIGKKLNK